MAALNPLILPELLDVILEAIPPDQDAYLVGGTVRDYLLGKTAHDYDFVLSGDPRAPARRIANRLNAAFYALDDDRKTYRVIHTPSGISPYIVDFSGLRGPDLSADLRARDFTVNAIAVSIRDLHKLIDPLGGAEDLRSRLLRECSPSSMFEDPLRLVRGVRLAASLNFHILPETLRNMREAIPLLKRVSPERKRDELFKILDGSKPAGAVRTLDQIGILPEILPELAGLKGVPQSLPHISDVWNHTLSVVEHLRTLLVILGSEDVPGLQGNIYMGMASLRLGRYRSQNRAHFAEALNPNRSLESLLLLAALYHDIAKPVTLTVEQNGRIRNLGHEDEGAEIIYRRAQALQLSNAECERLRTIVRHHMRIHLLVQTGKPPSRRAIYRFFRDTGSAGVDICFHVLADTLGTYGPTLDPDKWQAYLDVCRELLENWWEKPGETARPVILINGHELQDELGVSPGPTLGRLIEAIREAQATGKVHDRDQAVQYARSWLAGQASTRGGEDGR